MELNIKDDRKYNLGYWVFSTASWIGRYLGTTTKELSRNLEANVREITSVSSPNYVVVKNEGFDNNRNVWKIIVEHNETA